MRKVTYFAVFERDGNAWGVYFPDLPGCVSMGDSFENALSGAQESLELHLWGMEEDGDAVPAPTLPPFETAPKGSVVAPVTVYPDLVKIEMANRAVRANVSIPAWLKASAEAAGLSCSQVLQAALLERLGVADRRIQPRS